MTDLEKMKNVTFTEGVETTAKERLTDAAVSRETTISIALLDADGVDRTILMSEDQARIVYSQLRKWYGRSK